MAATETTVIESGQIVNTPILFMIFDHIILAGSQTIIRTYIYIYKIQTGDTSPKSNNYLRNHT